MNQQFLTEQIPIKDDKNSDMRSDAKPHSPSTVPFQMALNRCQLQCLPVHDQQTLLDGYTTLNSLRERHTESTDTQNENIDTQTDQVAYDAKDVDWDQAIQDGPELWQLLE
jgi:hypothetical protein